MKVCLLLFMFSEEARGHHYHFVIQKNTITLFNKRKILSNKTTDLKNE